MAGAEPVALDDVMPDGLSMLYSFYDPDLDKRGLGNLLILDHIDQVRMAGLSYVYLGYLGEGFARDGLQGPLSPARSTARSAGVASAEVAD